ncbi:VOC family protein [Blastococcus sp. SYSU D00695]
MTTTDVQPDQRPVLLDHVAIATRRLDDGRALFGGLLQGLVSQGGDSLGFYWRQTFFPSGPRVEVLTPTDPVNGAFLERFLDRTGPGFHHYNFDVPDLAATLAEVEAMGITPVQVRLEEDHYKEAFLRPGDAHGVVIQIVQHAERHVHAASEEALEADLAHVTDVEHHVADLDGALRLFTGPLRGRIDPAADDRPDSVVVTWPDQGRIRLVASTGTGTGHPAGSLRHLEFARTRTPFSPAERAAIDAAAARLGVTLRLAEPAAVAAGTSSGS